MSIPIIKLSLENMRHEILVAIHQHMMANDIHIQKSLEAICTEEHISSLFNAEVVKALSDSLGKEISDWFKYGEGRDLIKSAVAQKMSQHFNSQQAPVYTDGNTIFVNNPDYDWFFRYWTRQGKVFREFMTDDRSLYPGDYVGQGDSDDYVTHSYTETNPNTMGKVVLIGRNTKTASIHVLVDIR